MKRCLVLLSLVMLLSSCGKQVLNGPPLEYSFMPKYLDLDSIQPVSIRDTSEVVDSTYADFKSIPLDSGKLLTIYGDTVIVPGGILISDRKAALYSFYKSSWERQTTELKYTNYLMETYHGKAKTAEVLYQDEIMRLRKKAKRNWVERNAGYLGFTAALAVMILRDYALDAIFR